MTRRAAALLATLLAALMLVAAGCGGDGDGERTSGSGGGGEATAEATPTAEAGEQAACEGPEAERAASVAAGDNDLSKKPRIAKPSGDPPTELEVTDIVVGKGACATSGSQVTVQYVGVSWSTGEQFDASWDSGQPFSFALGAGMVIQGWDQGVAGMRVGGRRKLVIPPDLGYGAQANGPIAANETLVFVVDLKEVG